MAIDARQAVRDRPSHVGKVFSAILIAFVRLSHAAEPRSSDSVERLAEREAEFEMVAIPAGEFKLRALEVDPKNPNNSVRHKKEYSVRLSPFWIGKYEMA